MKFSLEINKPCGENWNKMPKSEQGKYCSVCDKDLVDFTSLTNHEIYKVVNSDNKICGKFSQQQLNSEFEYIKTNTISKIGFIASFSSLLSFVTPVMAQTNESRQVIVKNNDTTLVKTPNIKADSLLIEGEVFSKDEGVIPFARVVINDSLYAQHTGFDGKFNLILPLELFNDEVQLKVEYLGYNSKELIINENSTYLKIDLTSQRVELLGEICVIYPPTRWQKFTDFFRRKSKKKYVSHI